MAVTYQVGPDGLERGTVTFTWEPVTTAEDGSNLVVQSYLVDLSTDDGETWNTCYVGHAGDTSGQISDLPVPMSGLLRVTAVSISGEQSDPSPAIAFDLTSDLDPPAVPTVPVLSSDFRMLTVKWDGALADAIPDDFDRVVVTVSQTSGDLPSDTNQYGYLREAGTITVPDLPTDVDLYVRLSSVDKRGNWSDPSDEATIQVHHTVDVDAIVSELDGAVIDDGSIVASAKVVAGSVVTANLAALAVTTDKLAANCVTADQMDAGAINGMIITGATIQSSAEGSGIARWYGDTYGLHFLDSTGASQVEIDSASGVVYVNSALSTSVDDNNPHIQVETSTVTFFGDDAVQLGQINVQTPPAGAAAGTSQKMVIATDTPGHYPTNDVGAAVFYPGGVELIGHAGKQTHSGSWVYSYTDTYSDGTGFNASANFYGSPTDPGVNDPYSSATLAASPGLYSGLGSVAQMMAFTSSSAPGYSGTDSIVRIAVNAAVSAGTESIQMSVGNDNNTANFEIDPTVAYLSVPLASSQTGYDSWQTDSSTVTIGGVASCTVTIDYRVTLDRWVDWRATISCPSAPSSLNFNCTLPAAAQTDLSASHSLYPSGSCLGKVSSSALDLTVLPYLLLNGKGIGVRGGGTNTAGLKYFILSGAYSKSK